MIDLLHPLLLGMDWMDPMWLLDRFGPAIFWISLIILVIECGLFFPFLPGDTLLFAMGLFIATEQVDLLPGGRPVELTMVMAAFAVAAFAGNVVGYEIGRAVGVPLRHREGRVLKKKYFDQTEAFFERHGNKALVIGRFVPVVRTYVTVVAGITRMNRARFFVWSAVGAIAWVVSLTLLGYFLGDAFPTIGERLDLAIILIVAVSLMPMVWEWWRHRRTHGPESEDNDADGVPDRDIAGADTTRD